MARYLFIISLAVMFVVSACSSTQHAATHYSFAFEHEGSRWEIISVVLPDDGGHNYLTLRNPNEIVVSAKDEDQNGTIDTVLVGDVSLEEANSIYLAGIEFARGAGRYREQYGSRVFEFTVEGQSYIVQSFVPRAGGEKSDIFNFITFRNIEGAEVIAVDDLADGTVDRIKKGPCDVETVQPVYAVMLDAGVGQGRIRVADGHYVVRSIE